MKNITQTGIKNLLQAFFGFFLLIISFSAMSQGVGINMTGSAPDANAGLDVNFPDKGILIPRVALTSTISASPLSGYVAGMMVYNTSTTGDVTPGFYYCDGSKWIASLPSGNASGDMLYWNGSAWLKIPAGNPGQFLQFGATVHLYGQERLLQH